MASASPNLVKFFGKPREFCYKIDKSRKFHPLFYSKILTNISKFLEKIAKISILIGYT